MSQSGRMTRRIAGFLKTRIPELKLEELEDCRRKRGRRWPLKALLTAALSGLMVECKSLAEVEWLTEDLSVGMRRLLGVFRRVPDTTLRDLLVRLNPFELRQRLHGLVKAAHHRKALRPVGFPFGVVSADMKAVTIPGMDNRYAQRHRYDDGRTACGLVRTVTCALVSSPGTPCIDSIPLLAGTNEMGAFARNWESLMKAYGDTDLFQLVTYDAGASSERNGRLVVESGKDYLFRLRANQGLMMRKARLFLAHLPSRKAVATTRDVITNDTVVTRRMFWVKASTGYRNWSHVRTILRVQSTTEKSGEIVEQEDRYYLSSLELKRLTPDQWLSLVRCHWGVENNCHNTFDKLFREDTHPWIELSPQGTLAMVLLRRIAYTLLTLFRSVTQRSEENRQMPWRRLFLCVRNALVTATPEQLGSLRARTAAAFR